MDVLLKNLTTMVVAVAVTINAPAKSADFGKVCSALQDFAVPVYPADAVAAGVQGDVMLLVTIGSDGSVADVTVESGTQALAEPARSAARQWHFARGPLASSVPKQAQIAYRFELGSGIVSLSNEQKHLTVHVPAEVTDKTVVDAGQILTFLAATRPQPRFPSTTAAMNQRIVVDVETGSDGHVSSHQSQSGDRAYRAVAEQTAGGWTFRDIRVDGARVRLKGQVVFIWHIE